MHLLGKQILWTNKLFDGKETAVFPLASGQGSEHSVRPAVLNWRCSRPQGVEEGSSWGENFTDNTKNNTSNGRKGCKDDFSIRTGSGLQNELRTAELSIHATGSAHHALPVKNSQAQYEIAYFQLQMSTSPLVTLLSAASTRFLNLDKR